MQFNYPSREGREGEREVFSFLLCQCKVIEEGGNSRMRGFFFFNLSITGCSRRRWQVVCTLYVTLRRPTWLPMLGFGLLYRERGEAGAAEDREQWYYRSWRIARTTREKGKAYCQL